MRVTPEWYEQYQKRRELAEVRTIGREQEKRQLAREWNGNIEPVEIVSGHAITLPWPPSGNTAVRHAKNVHYIRDEVVTYRQSVAVLLGRSEPVSGTYELHLELSPPDKRRRDVDNVLKTLLDSLVLCGWLPDDSMKYMKRLSVIVKDDCRGEVIAQVKAV